VENYTKGEVIEETPSPLPFKDLQENFVHMKVQPSSKLRNILEFSKKAFQDESKRHMVFTGSGHALGKTITCVEIMKRKHKQLHQVNKICYKKVEEIWEPKCDDLDKLKVVREIPTIHILLSKDPVDTAELG
ncbi:unnamed protein product, partial [Ixodes hexagonus]